MNLARNSARTSVLIAAATCVIFTAELTAQFTVVSQNRSVSANAQLSSCIFEGPGEFPVAAATMSTENAGVFSQSVDANMSVTTTPGLACVAPSEEIASSATQDTVIAGAILQGTGIAQAGKGGGSTESGEAAGRSMLSVNFQVPAAMPYLLFGSVDGLESSPGGFRPGAATVSLKQGDTIIHSVTPHTPDFQSNGTEQPYSFGGVLLPGVYTLDAIASASASGPIEQASTSNFSFTFVPEPTMSWYGFALVAILTTHVVRASSTEGRQTNRGL